MAHMSNMLSRHPLFTTRTEFLPVDGRISLSYQRAKLVMQTYGPSVQRPVTFILNPHAFLRRPVRVRCRALFCQILVHGVRPNFGIGSRHGHYIACSRRADHRNTRSSSSSTTGSRTAGGSPPPVRHYRYLPLDRERTWIGRLQHRNNSYENPPRLRHQHPQRRGLQVGPSHPAISLVLLIERVDSCQPLPHPLGSQK